MIALSSCGSGLRELALLGMLCLSLILAAPARAAPGVGLHETVAIAATTTAPNSSTGLLWMARYHSAKSLLGDPPPLRRLAIRLPPGTRYDTSVPARCTASDLELMLLGEAACPTTSRVGSSQATLKIRGLGAMTYPGVDFNADHQLIELFESGGRPVGVIRTYVDGSTLQGPVPTCVTGGNPPTGCPFDQLTLLANRIDISPASVGTGRKRRNLGTTPARCPASGRWQTPVTFYYADGSIDHVTTQQPCQHRAAHHTHRPRHHH